jgi:dihydrodipicolinate synthase/N-acetylneuraminate lyase
MNKVDKKYSGVVVPMVTPLTKKGKIDDEAVGRIMEEFAKNDISPLILGTTGESSSFTKPESLQLLAATVAAKSKKQKVYAGVVSNCFEQQARLGGSYLDLNADAIVATLPGYYVLTDSQITSHFINLADAIKGDLIVYNIKATTQMSIPLPVIEALGQHEHIVGLKDSERDEERMKACISLFKEREDFSYFCGWGAKSTESLALGADGIVPSTGNLVAAFYKEMINEAKQNNWSKANDWQMLTDRVAEVYQHGRTLGQSLAALKLLMSDRGLCKSYMKPPLSLLEPQQEEAILAAWKNLEIEF